MQHTMNTNASASAVHTHLSIVLMNCRRTLIKQRQPQRHTLNRQQICIDIKHYIYILSDICLCIKLHNLFGQIVQNLHFAASSLLFHLRNSFAFKWFQFTSSPGIVYGHNEESPAAVALVHLANFDLQTMLHCLSLSLCLSSQGEGLDLTSPWELAQPMGNQREASAIPRRR